MDTKTSAPDPREWIVTATAAALLAITVGQRSALGLFVSPLNSSTELGIVAISLAMAIGQVVWGAAQPIVGLLADRFGPVRVISAGAALLAATNAVLPFGHSEVAIAATLSLGAAAAAATGGNALLLGIVSQRSAPERRGVLLGVVSAGGSAGQLVLAPVVQAVITVAGWANALYALAALSLVPALLAPLLGPRAVELPTAPAPPAAGLGDALRAPAYWLVNAGFFVCGFHVAFLLAHMPGVIEMCGFAPSLAGTWIGIVGVCNVAGSLVAGFAIRHVSMKWTLAALYAARAAGVAAFLALPKTEWTILGFAVWMGITYMATLPPTTGLIGKLFGVARVGPLLGVTMLVHQVGSFLGVWLGGVAVARTGSYDALWVADATLAVVAALVHVPLRESPARAGPRRLRSA